MFGRGLLGGALCLLGGLWIGQGVGAVKGSFMTGQSTWTVIGAIVAGVGLLLIVSAFRRRRGEPPS
jgi:uncharacterized membrane protein HdeD (DUF308 family)